MLREAYKVVVNAVGGYEIVKVEITDLDGVSWQTAKKQLRQHYLDKARELRKLTQETYFQSF